MKVLNYAHYTACQIMYVGYQKLSSWTSISVCTCLVKMFCSNLKEQSRPILDIKRSTKPLSSKRKIDKPTKHFKLFLLKYTNEKKISMTWMRWNKLRWKHFGIEILLLRQGKLDTFFKWREKNNES